MTYYFAGASTRALDEICLALQEAFGLPPFVRDTFDLSPFNPVSWEVFDYAPRVIKEVSRKELKQHPLVIGTYLTWDFGWRETNSCCIRVTKAHRGAAPEHWMHGFPTVANCQVAVSGLRDSPTTLTDRVSCALKAYVEHYATVPQVWTVDNELDIPFRYVRQTGGPGRFACFTLRLAPDLSYCPVQFKDELDYDRPRSMDFGGWSFAPHYAQGVREGVERFAHIYAQSGRPLAHVSVTLHDLICHEVDSHVRDFRDSAFEAMWQAFQQHGLAI